jgi:hypothetical protein
MLHRVRESAYEVPTTKNLATWVQHNGSLSATSCRYTLDLKQKEKGNIHPPAIILPLVTSGPLLCAAVSVVQTPERSESAAAWPGLAAMRTICTMEREKICTMFSCGEHDTLHSVLPPRQSPATDGDLLDVDASSPLPGLDICCHNASLRMQLA